MATTLPGNGNQYGTLAAIDTLWDRDKEAARKQINTAKKES